ncbi:MAG: ABC transporter permease [Microbacterium sp.]
MSLGAGVVGPLAEAWQELRVSRLRVLLSLIVVAVSVAAFTGVVALGQVLSQGLQEQMERQGGRPALVSFNAYDTTSGNPVDPAAFEAGFRATTDRYDVEWWSRNGWLDISAGDEYINAQAVDPDYGVMHRIRMAEGDWFTDGDATRFVPVIVINQWWWQQIGSPPISTHPTVSVSSMQWDENGNPISTQAIDALVIGVSAGGEQYDSAYLLYDDTSTFIDPADLAGSTGWEVWLPPGDADVLSQAMTTSIMAHLPDGVEVDSYRTDYLGGDGGFDGYRVALYTFGGIALLILFLGALSLLNITLVTIKHRVREIGVRRSFGATAGRVFFSVMLESVVGTVVAGVAGIVLVIFLFRLPMVHDQLAQALENVPSFPLAAAFIGLLTSAAVGALAGLVPALVAVRVKPIDAIRY